MFRGVHRCQAGERQAFNTFGADLEPGIRFSSRVIANQSRDGGLLV